MTVLDNGEECGDKSGRGDSSHGGSGGNNSAKW